MADEAGFRTYLRDVIGVPDPRERREAIQEQGLNTINDLLEFDKESIDTLCYAVRKPGGTIPDPDPNAAANATIPNPGYSVPAICEKRLIAAAYTAKMYEMIGRPITADTLSRARIKRYEAHKTLMDDHEDPEKLPQVSKTFGIVKAMDLVPSHLRDRLGVRKVPLSYVIRDVVAPGDAPLPAARMPTAQNFNSISDELIHYTPHSGDEYAEDNAKVFQILQDMVAGTSYETSVKSYQRRRDGRGAYLALLQHNLGSSKWDKILEDAETYVSKREWNGRNQRFSLKSHINKHREAHNDMVHASQHVEYALPNEHTRVGRLIKSITTKEPAIVSALTHIMGNNQQRNDFETAADFLLLTAPSNTNMSNNQRVSATNTNNNTKNGGKTSVELRYYSKSEYAKLSNEQKKELHEMRKKKKGNNNNDVNVSSVKELQDEIKELEKRLIAAIATANKDSEEKPPTQPPKNPLQNPLNQRN